MTLSGFCVTRPVATVVLMLLLIVFGLIALSRMPVREYPDIDVPTVSVDTTYDGASANVVETKITQIIEDAVAGIEGLDSIDSISRDGRSRVTIEFSVDRDIDAAANDVRDKVSRVLKKLPDEADSPVIAKFDSGGQPVVMISITSPGMTRMELTDYADRYLTDRFSVIDGVASVGILGAQEQSMRIWLDRKAMAARGVSVGDIEDALESENVENPGGRIESSEREFTVRIRRQYQTPEDFRRLVLRRDDNGNFIRLEDVARIELSARRPRSNFLTNGEPMVGLAVYKQSKSNVLTISKGVTALVGELNRNGLPKGMSLRVIRDEARFINESIREVKGSLAISAVLVIAIIFLFLGSMRASLIPALTVPVSLIASFIVLYLMDYSINLLTLLALVLAIGMVVDDAIVMLENTHRRTALGEPPMLAAVRGADQVLFAVIATTLVLCAVFLPICLWTGKTGKLFAEFSVAMTAAVCFSSVVALTLTPMLCARLLKPAAEDTGFLGCLIDRAMLSLSSVYEKLLRRTARFGIFNVFLFFAFCVLTAALWRTLPEEYEPEEDRGVVMTRVQAPEGTNYYAINRFADEVEKILEKPVSEGSAGSLMVVIPSFGESDGAVNTAFCILELAPWSARGETTARKIMDSTRGSLSSVTGVKALPFLPSGLGGFGNPVQFVIGGPDYGELVKWRDRILEKCRDYPGITDIDWDYKETTPQFHVDIDRDRAGELGVSAKDIGLTLETMLGAKQITTFVDRGQEYDVMVQAGYESRANPSDLTNIHVRSASGKLIPLDNLVKVTERGDSGRLGRYNRVRAITLTANVASGHSLGEVLAFLEKTVRTELPEYAQIGYKRQSLELKRASGSMLYIFGLALLISFLALAAQFESFLSPAIVMLTVPLGMAGAVAALHFYGFTMNIYTQIGIIMLIGLAAKNGILIVEFANQLRDAGKPFEEAVYEASKLRLRPILMTGVSTVAGAVPLVLATGAGAAGRRCLGAVVVYGGLSACVLTLFIIPSAYLILARHSASPQAGLRKLRQLEKEDSSNVC